MARSKIYNITSFNGGMTQNLRDTRDLSKCAYVSHFDIYRDPNQMYVMPGYVDDMSIGGDADGMKAYDIRAFAYLTRNVFAVGTKSNGTGSKVFRKLTPETAEWDDTPFGSAIETTNDLVDYTYLAGNAGDFDYMYWLTNSSGNLYITQYDSGGPTVNETHQLVSSGGAASTIPVVSELHYTGVVYASEGPSTGLTLISTAATDDTKTTAIFVKDVQSGGEQLGLIGNPGGERRARLLLWDSQSILIDQNIDFGKGTPVALGYPSGFWVGVINEGIGSDTFLLNESNESASFSIKVANGSSAETLYRFYGASASNGVMLPTRSQFKDTMLWYSKVATNTSATEFREGVWACGKGNINDPLAVSVLLDTSSLGTCSVVKSIGNHIFIVHGGDGSISRLDSFSDGTYDVPATYESLIFGAETPQLKQFEGISVVTEDLPASASVQVYYRTDVDSSWTSLGTSSTTGLRKHNFAASTPIGKFQEIQFKIVVTGKTQIKNIRLSLTELDDLPNR